VSEAAALAAEAVRGGASQKASELAPLIETLLELDPKVILEIGSSDGGTLRCWRLVAPRAFILSVSLPDGPYGGGHPRDVDAHVIAGDSHDMSSYELVIGALDGRMVDFLFLDGDHTFSGIRSDYHCYGPLVRRGGIIALHDILPHVGDTVQVDRFWERLKSMPATYSRVDEHVSPDELRAEYGQWGGIGVVHK